MLQIELKSCESLTEVCLRGDIPVVKVLSGQANTRRRGIYLDSAVGMKFQYLLSPIPVIDNAFEDIHIQINPLFFSRQNSCIFPIHQQDKNSESMVRSSNFVAESCKKIPPFMHRTREIRTIFLSEQQFEDDTRAKR